MKLTIPAFCIATLFVLGPDGAAQTTRSADARTGGWSPALSPRVQQEVVGPNAESEIAGPSFPLQGPSPGGDDVELRGTREPTIVVNPLDPDNLAYASLFELRVSTDGGQTWLPRVQAPEFPGSVRNGDPSLAFDPDGRLYWTYLSGIFQSGRFVGRDIALVQCDPSTGSVLPGYPVNVTASPGVALPGASGFNHDKQWLAVDTWPASPYRGRLYVAWTEFSSRGTVVWVTSSDDEGWTWTPAVRLDRPVDGFVWPTHVTVAPNGDVYVSYHDWDGGGGLRGRVLLYRSTDGGASFPHRLVPFARGEADVTFNVQSGPYSIPGAQFWLQGNAQAWVVADPFVEGRIYVVAADDPDDDHTSGDAADVVLATSEDHGENWTKMRIDHAPPGSFQVMPTAAIDPATGLLAVHWYDNRNGVTNDDGNWKLDLYATFSLDGGRTFLEDFQVNDRRFDPDPGAPERFSGPPPTTRIGEYNGVALGAGKAHAVWCGSRFRGGMPSSQQILYDGFSVPVAIEVRPGTALPSIQPGSRGVIPVAVLSTPGFDATTLDPLTASFGPNGAGEAHGRGHVEDVDGDGLLDMVLHFRTQETGFLPGTAEAHLRARTFAGAELEGSDTVEVQGAVLPSQIREWGSFGTRS